MSKFTRMPQYIKDAYKKHCFAANRGGATNAIIAGGAIRDTLNGVWVKDIDIFVDASCAARFEGIIDEWSMVGSRASKLFDRYGDAMLWQPTTPKSAPSMSIPYGATQGSTSVYMNNKNGMITFSSLIANAATDIGEKDDYMNNNRVVEVYERYDTVDGITYPLNLIFTECPPVEYVTKYFDFGICKAWYDGTYVQMHGDYTNDVNNKTITMVLPEEHVIACYGSLAKGISSMQEHAERLRYKYPSHSVVMPSV